MFFLEHSVDQPGADERRIRLWCVARAGLVSWDKYTTAITAVNHCDIYDLHRSRIVYLDSSQQGCVLVESLPVYIYSYCSIFLKS